MNCVVNISCNEKATFNGEVEVVWGEKASIILRYCTMKPYESYWWEGHKEGDHQEDQDVGGWIILR
jgi:hypothetical protein